MQSVVRTGDLDSQTEQAAQETFSSSARPGAWIHLSCGWSRYLIRKVVR